MADGAKAAMIPWELAMDSIRREVRASAVRDLSLAVLATLALMLHFAGDPINALKAGAIGFTFAALLMIERIARAERQEVVDDEAWNNLRADEQPPPAIASREIRRAERQVCGLYGWYASGVSLALWMLMIGGSLLTL